MRDTDGWHPSKVTRAANGTWVANPDYVRGGSLYAVGLLADALVPVIEREAKGRLLDAGCGDVPYYGVYRARATEVTCIDWEASSHGARHVDRAVDLNGPLPFADAAFDTVLLADVLEHVAAPRTLMAELGRVLAPAGALIVSVPFLYWVHEAPHDYFRYTEYGLRHLCTETGLEVEECEPYGGHPDVLIDLVGKVLARSRRMGTVYARVCRRLVRTPPAPRLRERTRRTFPLGYVMVARA